MNEINNISKKLVEILNNKKLQITAMESCTGGFFLSCITNINGSSNITEGGLVTYSNNTKIKNGVDKKCIDQYGVYSKETAISMAKACKIQKSNKEKTIGVGITGFLSGIDTNSKLSKVYYSIDYTDGKTSASEITLDTGIERYNMKKFIVKIIMNEIIKYLENKEK